MFSKSFFWRVLLRPLQWFAFVAGSSEVFSFSPTKRAALLLPAFFLILFSSCDPEEKVDIDRRAMLENYANNVIIPSFTIFKTKVDLLKQSSDTFTTSPDVQKLQQLQQVFLNTYRAWQIVEVYEFGPAKDVVLRSSLNTFPTDTGKIGNNIRSGNYDLEVAANISAKGLPALDFLLFGIAPDDAAITALYTNDVYSANRVQYLNDLVNEIQQKTNSVVNAWQAGYKETFINADGTDAGSSLALLVNELNYTWELTKNPRIGIPLGKRSLNVPLPEKTEAYYSGISVELAVLNLQNIRRVFLGEGPNGISEGESLKSNLDELNAEYNGQPLSQAIITQIDLAMSKTALIPDPLSDAVIQNKQTVDEAYIEIQKTVILIKTDMPSAMGVLISYQDSDGD